MVEIGNILDSIRAVKNTVRTGWMLRGIPASIGETVAEHIFEASIIAYILSNELKRRNVNVNVYKAVTLAMFHDLPEAFIGDIVRHVKEAIPDTRKLEENIAREKLGNEVAELIREFNEMQTVEAKVARLAETLATYVQGVRYLSNGYSHVVDIVENTLEEARKLTQSEPLSKISDVVEKIVLKTKRV